MLLVPIATTWLVYNCAIFWCIAYIDMLSSRIYSLWSFCWDEMKLDNDIMANIEVHLKEILNTDTIISYLFNKLINSSLNCNCES